MEFNQIVPVPVILNSNRPGRNRGRLNSEHPNHQTVYMQDEYGMLTPGGPMPRHGRSASVSGPYAPPASVIVNNEVWQETSPQRGHHRRSSHGHDHHYSDDEDWEGHRRQRRHSRGRGSRGRSSRTPSPYYDSETEERLRKLKKLEQKEEEEAAQERWEEEQILKAVRKEKKKKEEEEMKKRAVQEYELKKLEDEAKAKKKKDEEEDAFRQKAIETFSAAGYSKKSVIGILEAAEKGKKVKGGGKEVMDLTRPTYIKVHQKHLSPETLDAYNLPWEWHDRDSNYIIIKRWIPERDQDILFEHTKKLRERKLLTDTTVELKKERDQLMLVRKRSPARARSKSRQRAWLIPK